MAEPVPDLLRITEVALRLRCSRRKVYALLGAGELESVKIERQRLVFADSVDSLIERCRVAGDTRCYLCGGDEGTERHGRGFVHWDCVLRERGTES